MSHINSDIKTIVTEIYESLLNVKDGKVADYIPQLGKVNPELFGISICSVDGELYNFGDVDNYFCVQSCSKPISYCIARDIYGLTKVHQHVGYEPSGNTFNAHILNEQKLPHNPMINAGAIMIASLICPDKEPSERFDIVKQYYHKMTGNIGDVGFDNSTFLSEKCHADRNMSLAYYMRESNSFDGNQTQNDITEHLDLYFQCCSININCKQGSIIAATWANSGICPITQQKVFEPGTVRDCLSLMYMCGMYDFSGQFAFEIGLPAKSGVSGCLFLVIPGKYGICIWSPRLDKSGNSVRGVQFCKQFIQKQNYHHHIFHSICSKNIIDEFSHLDKDVLSQLFIQAASKGDIERLSKLLDYVDINCSDYDGRTGLHLAAVENKLDVVTFLLKNGSNKDLKDRWGNTALYDIEQLAKNDDSYHDIISFIKNYNDVKKNLS